MKRVITQEVVVVKKKNGKPYDSGSISIGEMLEVRQRKKMEERKIETE